MRRYVYLGLTIVCLAQQGYSQRNSTASAPVVSILQLISEPERFAGTTVTLIGFLRIENEGNLLYINKADYENVVLANTIWVDVTREMAEKRESINLKYVRITGTFNVGHKLKGGFSVGGLSDITNCEFWSDPANPLEERIKSMSH
jgi:hypothetical protein